MNGLKPIRLTEKKKVELAIMLWPDIRLCRVFHIAKSRDFVYVNLRYLTKYNEDTTGSMTFSISKFNEMIS